MGYEGIAEDMNELARQGYEVQFAFPIDFHNEVNRHPDPQPGLNDGDHISSQGEWKELKKLIN